MQIIQFMVTISLLCNSLSQIQVLTLFQAENSMAGEHTKVLIHLEVCVEKRLCD